MLAVLLVVFLVLPIAELYVIVQVAQGIGILETIGLLLAVSFVGAWLCKREGLATPRRVRDALDRYELPHNELVDGALILFAGALLICPGFLSDCLGIVLLLPPTRAAIRRVVLGAFRRRIAVGGIVVAGDPPPIDTTGRPWRG